jgi:hypothetical protein
LDKDCFHCQKLYGGTGVKSSLIFLFVVNWYQSGLAGIVGFALILNPSPGLELSLQPGKKRLRYKIHPYG